MGKFEKQIIEDSINRLDNYLYKSGWKAYDPFDGLNAKVLTWLTFKNHYLRIIQQQSIRRFPINLRPIFGISKQTSSKGMGFCALGYLKLYQATQKDEYLEKMQFCLDWLKNNFIDGHAGYSWGNHLVMNLEQAKFRLTSPLLSGHH